MSANRILMIVGVSATVVISIIVVFFFLQNQTDRMNAEAERKYQYAVGLCNEIIDAHDELQRSMGNYSTSTGDFEKCMQTGTVKQLLK